MIFMVHLGCSQVPKNTQDIQLAQSMQNTVAVYFVSYAIQYKIMKSELYNDLANKEDIKSNLINSVWKVKILDSLGHKWKTDRKGNFVTKSGSLVYLKIIYSEKYVFVQFVFYEDYPSFNNGVHSGKTDPSYFYIE